MLDFLLKTAFVTSLTIVSATILAVRDLRYRRRERSHMSIDAQIAEMREGAAFMIHELQDFARRRQSDPGGPQERIFEVIEFYERLEKLASSSDASEHAVMELCNEATHYVRENRFKGIQVGEMAHKLAELTRIRAASDGS